ncbi:MAG TPA: leucyl aminopeptidase [Acidimicrobiales bacterium]|nr:leucyl aminopeptidase [Acidimicrobiales bacterium]
MPRLPAPARAEGALGPRQLLAFDAAARLPGTAKVVGVLVPAGARSVKAPPGITLSPAYLALRGFEGKRGQSVVVPGPAGKVVLALGTGSPGGDDLEALRLAGAALVRGSAHAAHAALYAGSLPRGVDPAAAGQALAEGASLAAYRYTTFKSDTNGAGRPRLERVTVVGGDPVLAAGLERGAVVASAVALARDLVNEPPGSLTPTRMADIATRLAARSGLEATAYDSAAIDAERLGGLAGVARGSEEEPRLVRLEYTPRRADASVPTVALVGKGITFDSGGLSLKTADGMMTMKTDMSGAAAVLAAMSVLGRLGVPVRVVGFMPLTENMPGGRAIKPGDVLRARNGKTIEVLNTDAEGRLVLADAISLAVEEGPAAVIDLATLTGAVVVALGRRIAGLMGNDDELAARLEESSARAGERLWRLPLPDDYRKDIDSEVADIKNIGGPGSAGSIIAGLFLREFVDGVPWAHLDIAGTARSDADDGYTTKGATGFGVRTLLELLGSWDVSAPA